MFKFHKLISIEHHNSEFKFLTSAQRHNGEGEAIMENRRQVYKAAKAAHPKRWNGRKIRDWFLPNELFLNPEKKIEKNKINAEKEKSAR